MLGIGHQQNQRMLHLICERNLDLNRLAISCRCLIDYANEVWPGALEAQRKGAFRRVHAGNFYLRSRGNEGQFF